jgi:hypothetical protein
MRRVDTDADSPLRQEKLFCVYFPSSMSHRQVSSFIEQAFEDSPRLPLLVEASPDVVSCLHGP